MRYCIISDPKYMIKNDTSFKRPNPFSWTDKRLWLVPYFNQNFLDLSQTWNTSSNSSFSRHCCVWWHRLLFQFVFCPRTQRLESSIPTTPTLWIENVTNHFQNLTIKQSTSSLAPWTKLPILSNKYYSSLNYIKCIPAPFQSLTIWHSFTTNYGIRHKLCYLPCHPPHHRDSDSSYNWSWSFES